MPRVPVLEERENVKTVGVLLVTGDRGLAGAFNTQIIREGMRLAASSASEGVEVVFSVVGRKGVSAMTFRSRSLRSPTSASPTAPASPTRARSART